MGVSFNTDITDGKETPTTLYLQLTPALQGHCHKQSPNELVGKTSANNQIKANMEIKVYLDCLIYKVEEITNNVCILMQNIIT